MLNDFKVTTPFFHDGESQVRSFAGIPSLLAATWPETALLVPAIAALSGAWISTLDLSGKHFPTEVLSASEAEALRDQPALRALTVDGVTLEFKTLESLIRNLPNLACLNAAGLDIDDANVTSLAVIGQALVQLHLGRAEFRVGHRFTASRLTGAAVASLQTMPALKSLSLREVPLDDAQVQATSLWNRLTSLDLSGTAISDKGACHIAQSPALRTLSVAETFVGDVGARELLKRQWAALDLSVSRVSQGELLTAPVQPALVRLALASLEIDDRLADWLGAATSLQEVDLSDTQCGDGVARSLGTLPALRRVKLNRARPGDAGIAALLRASIEDLEIGGIRAGSESLRAISKCQTLRCALLNIGDDWSEVSAVRAALHLDAQVPATGMVPPTLRSLTLDGILSKAFSADLGKVTRLRSLLPSALEQGLRLDGGYSSLEEFFGEKLGIDDGLASELLTLPSICALYISHNRFGAALAGRLSPTIHTLELRGTEVADDAIEAITALPRLHCIDVPQTQVTVSGVAKLVREAVNLQSLAVDGTQVERESISALSQAKRLLELYLYGPEVTARTIAALAPVRLREMVLIGTGITDDAVPHLAAIPGFRLLSLDDELSDEALAELQSLRPSLQIRARPKQKLFSSPRRRS